MGRIFGPDTGSRLRGPLRVLDRNPGQSQAYDDFVYGANPRQWCDWKWDFEAGQPSYTVDVPLFNVTNSANLIPTDDNARGSVVVPRTGRLVSAQLTAEDALATSDTNYITFTLANKLGSGSGTIAMLAATDANTTKATGGTAISAVTGRALTVHGTAANLNVAAGDILVLTATVTGTLANDVENPVVRLTFTDLPRDLTALATRTAGSPLIGPADDTLNGEITCKLNAANEVNAAGVYFGDQLTIPANRGFVFEARVKVSGCTTAEAVIIGMASAYNDTWDNVAKNCWFKLAASLALLAESDDATTDTDDQDLSTTLVADTYYLFRIDASDLGAIEFWLDDALVGTLAAAALAVTDLLQPVIAIRKASGTTVPTLTVDHVRVLWRRV